MGSGAFHPEHRHGHEATSGHTGHAEGGSDTLETQLEVLKAAEAAAEAEEAAEAAEAAEKEEREERNRQREDITKEKRMFLRGQPEVASGPGIGPYETATVATPTSLPGPLPAPATEPPSDEDDDDDDEGDEDDDAADDDEDDDDDDGDDDDEDDDEEEDEEPASSTHSSSTVAPTTAKSSDSIESELSEMADAARQAQQDEEELQMLHEPSPAEMAQADEKLLELMVRIAEDPQRWNRVHHQLQELDTDLSRVREIELESAAVDAGAAGAAGGERQKKASAGALAAGAHFAHNRWEEHHPKPWHRRKGHGQRPWELEDEEEEAETGSPASEESARREQLRLAGVLAPANKGGKSGKGRGKGKDKARGKGKNKGKGKGRMKAKELEKQKLEKERERVEKERKEKERKEKEEREKEEREKEAALDAVVARQQKQRAQKQRQSRLEGGRSQVVFGTTNSGGGAEGRRAQVRAGGERGGGSRAVSFRSPVSSLDALKHASRTGASWPEPWPHLPSPGDPDPDGWPDFAVLRHHHHHHHQRLRPHKEGAGGASRGPLEEAIAKHQQILTNSWPGPGDGKDGGQQKSLAGSSQQQKPGGAASLQKGLEGPHGAGRQWPHFAYHRVTTSPQMLAEQHRNAFVAVSLVPGPGEGVGPTGAAGVAPGGGHPASPQPGAPGNASAVGGAPSVEQVLTVRSSSGGASDPRPPADTLETQLADAARGVAGPSTPLPWSHARHLDRMQEQLRALSAVEERLRLRWLERERLRQMLRDGGTAAAAGAAGGGGDGRGAGGLVRAPRVAAPAAAPAP